MSLDECLGVVDQLADMGCELVTLSGGEPTLKKGWDTIASAIHARGIYVNMVTNGAYGSADKGKAVAQRARDAGMCNVGVSIDGPQAIHEHVRGPGTFADSIAAIGHFNAAGLKTAVMTTVNTLNLPHLIEMRRIAINAGATMWRLQLAKPMGTMGEHRDLVIDPEDLLTLMPLLAGLKKQGEIHLAIGDSIGYYGPHDKVLRGRGWRGRKECWKGCQAGMQAIGIEADGGIKGCLSLQAKWGDTDPFVEGNLRENTLEEIWNRPGIFAFNRDFHVDQLTGGCRACKMASLCRGGARCVSSATVQKVTEDPYCWYRVDCDQRTQQPGPMTQWAAAAGAAIVLSMGSGCSDSDPGAKQTADVVSPSDVTGTTDTTDTGEAVHPDYGVPPEDVSQIDTSAQLDYGVPPDDITEPEDITEPDTAITPDYGVPPDDITQPDDTGEPDTSTAPEYGIPPDDIIQPADAGQADAAAADAGEPDPCADACCDCDYGEPPPPECCED